MEGRWEKGEGGGGVAVLQAAQRLVSLGSWQLVREEGCEGTQWTGEWKAGRRKVQCLWCQQDMEAAPPCTQSLTCPRPAVLSTGLNLTRLT